MKFLYSFTALVLVFTLLLTPVFAQDEQASDSAKVDVYGLFWPVVPGKTLGDPMFMFKQLKETFGGMFIFGTVAKSEYQLELSEKRLVEAAKLTEDKDFGNAVKSIELNTEARVEALKLKKRAVEEKADTLELTNKLVKSFENQEKALLFLSSQMTDEQKNKLSETLKELPLQISEAK